MEQWNKLVIEETITIQRLANTADEKQWLISLTEFRKIFPPFLDWCEEEGLFTIAREHLRKNIHKLEPSLISLKEDSGILFYWDTKAQNCEYTTIEELMKKLEKSPG